MVVRTIDDANNNNNNNNNKCNFYLLKFLLNSPKTNYEVNTSKGKNKTDTCKQINTKKAA
jgi:hypothetical protein